MGPTLGFEETVGGIVARRPGAARVLERYGIDYCCGGKQTLLQACSKRGVDVGRVLGELESEPAFESGERSWSRASLTELADHIEQTHHAYLKAELPRLLAMTRKVAGVHGQKHPELVDLWDVYERFAEALSMHMLKEERILFPALRAMERTSVAPERLVEGPIACMIREHDDAGEALAKMRELTGGFTPPTDACATFKVLYASLDELERDMHRHVHKENSILFPMAARRVGEGSKADLSRPSV